MNDRLADLRSGGENLNDIAIDVHGEDEKAPITRRRSGSAFRPPSSSATSKAQSRFMAEFFSDVEAVKMDILAIRDATSSMAELNQAAMLATTQEREAELSHELEAIVTRANKSAAHAKALLEKMRTETDLLSAKKKKQPEQQQQQKEPETRIRENLCNTLTRKFVDVRKDYQNAQQKYKADIVKKVARQVQIVRPDATSEEIDAVLKGGNLSDVYKSAILKDEAADPIRNAYLNVADKYQDVRTLEGSVAELHKMFLDFALLTEHQGELLDQIEFQVQAAAEYVDIANGDMVISIEHQKNIRRNQCCLIIIVMLVITVVVLAAVFGTSSVKK